jgi:hypothetical protein
MFFLLSVAILSVTALTDPGYLPFFYPAADRTKFSRDELYDGCAVTEEQIAWARAQRRPGRIYFSRAAGWYIIRGDHYCKWTNNWIGLYNHRYYLQALLYIAIYVGVYILHLFIQYRRGKLALTTFEAVALLSVGIPYFYLICTALGSQLFLITRNRTLVEQVKRTPESYDRGCLANWEEIFGSRKYFLLWFLPVPLPAMVDGFGYAEERSMLEAEKV